MNLLSLHRVNHRPYEPHEQQFEWFLDKADVDDALEGNPSASYCTFTIDQDDPKAIVDLLNKVSP